MRLKMISMLAVASLVALFSTSCDKDDDPKEDSFATVCPKGAIEGDVVATAFGITLDPTNMSIEITDIKEKTFTLVVGELTINIPMQGKTVTRTLKEYKVEGVGYEYADGVANFLPGSFETTDGVYETIKVNIISGAFEGHGVTMSFTVQPDGMPMPMSLEYASLVE